jgi:hypothetical protein
MDDQLTTYRVTLPEGIDPGRHEQSYHLFETQAVQPTNGA